MAIGDLVEVKHRYSVAGQSVINTFGFKDLDGTHSFTQLAADLWSAANGLTIWMGGMADSVVTLDVTVQAVEPSTPATVVYTAASPPAGAVTAGFGGNLLPPANALVTTWRTALAGRSYRGRSYRTGYRQVYQDAGQWTSTALSGIATNTTAFFARYNVATGVYAHWGLVVISRQLNGAIRATPIGTDITSYTNRQVVYQQRRREIGVGI